MAEPPRDSIREASTTRPLSLRLRIWFACAGGALAVSSALWWIAGTLIGPRDTADPALLVVALLSASGLGLAVAVLLALWLDHHVVGQLRGLTRALESGAVEQLRDLPATSGWGELSALTHSAHELLARDRELADLAGARERVRLGLVSLRAAVERWASDEAWQVPTALIGDAAALGAALDRGFARHREFAAQNLEAARLVSADLGEARGDARESVEQAERGFVEATALLTTLRELQRLGLELQQTLAAAPASPPPAAERGAAFGEAAAEAIEELVAASSASVAHLAEGLTRVHDIVGQVHVVANRATLIALQASLHPGDPGDESGPELRTLARDVRTANERAAALAAELDAEVHGAAERMAGVRSRIADRLNLAMAALAAEPAPAPATRAFDDARRLMERVREMIQDAMRKGERLSAAGERSSRAAQRLVHRLDDETREIEGLAVRLGAAPAGPSPAAETSAPLRLVSDPAADEESGDRAGEGP